MARPTSPRLASVVARQPLTVSDANEAQAKYWSELASNWLVVEERIEDISAQLGRLAMDRLALRPGQEVIDVGCGSGRTTRELAARVSPGGRAMGVDIAAEMVAHAAAHAGSASAEFIRADVQTEDLGNHRFDAAFSRFGVMFFTDPVAAFTNVRRALRPGGALSFVCWQTVFENEWMLIPGMVAASVTGALPPAPAPEQPGPFSLADPARIRSVLSGAGFDEIEVTRNNDPLSIPEGRLSAFADQCTRVGAIREALREADEGVRQQVLSGIEEALSAKLERGEVRLSRGAHLVVAS